MVLPTPAALAVTTMGCSATTVLALHKFFGWKVWNGVDATPVPNPLELEVFAEESAHVSAHTLVDQVRERLVVIENKIDLLLARGAL